MTQCAKVVEVLPGTPPTFNLCPHEAAQSLPISVKLGGKEHIFRIDVCAWHAVEISFSASTAAEPDVDDS